jgi:oligoribonuclease (3'-5' exoribonuclease)
MTSTPTEVNPAPTHKPGPTHYAVIDFEGSGLLKAPFKNDGSRHRPGREADCILEVGLILLDAHTMEEVARHEWLVLPPGVETVAMFDAWATELSECNRFVFDMHSKSSPSMPSLLDALRNTLSDTARFSRDTLARAELDIFETLRPFADPGDTGKVHQGNSPVMFCGNSIANYDIPMMAMWMPRVHNILSYRTMDVSVLRTFYVEAAKVKLPDGLAESIKAGAGDHRAMADCVLCADNLRSLKRYARDAVDESAQ